MKHLRFPEWDPSDDLPNIWLDASQTGTGSIQDTAGGSISDTETVGHWISQGSDAYDFVQYSTNPRPTFESSGISGLPSIRFNDQILAVTSGSISGWNSMSAMTLVLIAQKVDSVPAWDPDGAFFTVIEPHESANADSGIVAMSQWKVGVFGKRLQAGSGTFLAGDVIPDGETLIETGVINWSAGTIALHRNGKLHLTGTLSDTGTTANLQPFSLCVGAMAQESVPTNRGLAMNGRIGELLIWVNRAFTPDELVGPHAYLARKWNPNNPAVY